MENHLLNTDIFETGSAVFDTTEQDLWTLAAAGDFRPTLEMQPALLHASFPTEEVQALLKADIVVGNLEAPIISNPELADYLPPSVSRRHKHLITSMSPAHAAKTRQLGFTHWNLANNHIRDAGPQGILETIQALDQLGLAHFGAGANEAQARRPTISNVRGVRIAFLGNAQDENIAAGPDLPGADIIVRENILPKLAQVRKAADVVVLSLHDGYEFSDVPRVEFFRLCREFVRNGADLILAHHPHVPHGIEIIDGSLIFYSLGNFYFRMQTLVKEDWTNRSFVPKVTFAGRRVQKMELIPIEMDENFHIRRSNPDAAQAMLRHLQYLTEMLDETSIDAANRNFVKDYVFDIVMQSVFAAGRQNDAEYLEKFLTQTIHKAPYLKCFKDTARLLQPERDFYEF